MGRFALVILLNIFFIGSVTCGEPYYHKVTAKKGDGVFSLLRRYKLVDESCNILKFYKLNNLKKEDHLLSGNKYFIPILIYNYNGESIRSTIGDDNFEKALGIQRYNEYLLKNKLRNASYRDSKILWVPFSSLYCGKSNKTSNQLASKSSPENKSVNSGNVASVVKVEDNSIIKPGAYTKKIKSDVLFGPQYASYEEVDQSLKNKVFYIVSGHGGPDPGAMCTTCPTRLCEDEYAYDVTLRLARNLKQHGAKVEVIVQDKNDGIRNEQFLICDKDEIVNGRSLPLKQRKRLAQRAEHINALHAKYKKQGYTDHTVVVLHVDAANEGARKDVFFYHHKNSKKGKTIATNIHETFKKKYERFQKGRGYRGTIRARGLYMLNHTNPPTVYIELANIHNPKDRQRILLDTNRQALANWIFLGLIK